ncbi:MAG: type II secretion system protein [Candidatus Gastranaerophilales bacterium]|nr:type II secretion system protein [Candidatus Gastranaerophilales bacterium]
MNKIIRIKNKAFTLAEILIALGIIGVIAAFVISPLVQEIQDTQMKIAWKKSFADISQAVKRLSIDYYGDFRGIWEGAEVTAAGHNDFRNKMLIYLNYTQKCDAASATGINGCWHATGNSYKLSGNAITSDWSIYSRAILNNGSLLIFYLQSNNCNNTKTPNSDHCGLIGVDVNGFNGPNKLGKDIFAVRILRNGTVIPYGTQGDYNYNRPSDDSCDVALYPNTSGWSCSADYLYK